MIICKQIPGLFTAVTIPTHHNLLIAKIFYQEFYNPPPPPHPFTDNVVACEICETSITDHVRETYIIHIWYDKYGYDPFSAHHIACNMQNRLKNMFKISIVIEWFIGSLASDSQCGFLRSPMLRNISKGKHTRHLILVRLIYVPTSKIIQHITTNQCLFKNRTIIFVIL